LIPVLSQTARYKFSVVFGNANECFSTIPVGSGILEVNTRGAWLAEQARKQLN